MSDKHNIANSAIVGEIDALEFIRSSYVTAEKQSIGYAVSRLCHLPGAAGHLCKAITSLEKVEALITRRIDNLKAKLPKEGQSIRVRGEG